MAFVPTISNTNSTTGNSLEEYAIIYGNIKNFELDKKIGKGQFSEVYRAKCITGKIVALKKIQVIFYNNKTF